MAALTIADFQPALKVIHEKLSVCLYRDNAAHALIPKVSGFGGRFTSVPLQYSNAPDGSADDTIAFGDVSGNEKYTEFQITAGEDYARYLVSGLVIAMSEGDKNAVISALKARSQATINTMARSIGNMSQGTGTGVRARMANTTTATTTVALADPDSIVHFEVGQRIQFVSADALVATTVRGTFPSDYLTIVTVNRSNGTFVVNATLTTMSGITTTDHIVRRGDLPYNQTTQISTGVARLPTGVGGWCPFAAPSSTSFFNVDRTTDLTRLGGNRYAGGGASKVDTLMRSAALLQREGSMADVCITSVGDFADLQVEREAKVMITGGDGGKNKVSFSAIEAATGYGKSIRVVADRNWKRGKFHILQLDTWKFRSSGEYARMLDVDGNNILRMAGANAYEGRMGGYGQYTCDAPGWNLAGTW